MPQETHKCRIEIDGISIECTHGQNLRKALMEGGTSPYTAEARYINCRGLGTCGTCAVRVSGKLSEKTTTETWRLNFPPHSEDQGLRLSCQARVLGDLIVVKGQGLWGHIFP